MALRVLEYPGSAPVQLGGVEQRLEQGRARLRREHHVLHDAEQLFRQPASPRLARQLELCRQPPSGEHRDGDAREEPLGEQASDRGVARVERARDADRDDPRIAARRNDRGRIVDLGEAAGGCRRALREYEDRTPSDHEPDQPLERERMPGIEDDVRHNPHQHAYQPMLQPIGRIRDGDASRQKQSQKRTIEHGIVVGHNEDSARL